jgi:hypothetical protein
MSGASRSGPRRHKRDLQPDIIPFAKTMGVDIVEASAERVSGRHNHAGEQDEFSGRSESGDEGDG